MGHLTDKLFTQEELKSVYSFKSYWEEILKRDEDRRDDCCKNEVQTIISILSPTQIIHILNEGMNRIDDETIT
jgi:hypothetical protein